MNSCFAQSACFSPTALHAYPGAQFGVGARLLWYKASAMLALEFHQSREHLFPSLIDYIPNHAELFQSSNAIFIERSRFLTFSLRLYPYTKLGVLWPEVRHIAMSVLFFVFDQIRKHSLPKAE